MDSIRNQDTRRSTLCVSRLYFHLAVLLTFSHHSWQSWHSHQHLTLVTNWSLNVSAMHCGKSWWQNNLGFVGFSLVLKPCEDCAWVNFDIGYLGYHVKGPKNTDKWSVLTVLVPCALSGWFPNVQCRRDLQGSHFHGQQGREQIPGRSWATLSKHNFQTISVTRVNKRVAWPGQSAPRVSVMWRGWPNHSSAAKLSTNQRPISWVFLWRKMSFHWEYTSRIVITIWAPRFINPARITLAWDTLITLNLSYGELVGQLCQARSNFIHDF